MRAPTDLQSSRQNDSLSGLKEGEKKEAPSTRDGMSEVEPSITSMTQLADPGASGEVMVQTCFCQNGSVMMPKSNIREEPVVFIW